jgi:hypothetical protein
MVMKRYATCLILLLAACGGGGSSSPTTPSAPDPNAIGPAGGTVTAENGAVRLTIPAGALTTPVSFTLRRATSVPADPRAVPDTAWDITPSAPFTTPATLTIRYDPARVPSGIAESDLRVFGVGAGFTWAPVAQSTVDVATREASGPITRTATFGVRAVD